MGKSMAWAFTTAYRSVQHTFIRLTPTAGAHLANTALSVVLWTYLVA